LMKNRSLFIAILGLAAAVFAIILNLAQATEAGAARTLVIAATVAAIIALSSGVPTFRKGGGWRFLAIAMIGPGVFVLTDAGMRLLFLLTHH
jgi:hypothetical protein